ncbi:MAG: LysM peptidoglycan-binding domain-containing protein [Nitrospira sp.]|nr:LysM peptidoglycan-binding domain-containing protein [Nitrospira sp.]
MSSIAGGLVSTVPIVVAGSVIESSTQIIVQSGDTLWRIARRYHVSVAALRRVNRLDGDAVQSGQALTIPGPSQSGS